MRQRYSFSLMLMVLISMFSMQAMAYDFEVDGIFYDKLSDTELAVVGGDGRYSGNIVIPDYVQYEGQEFTVTTIGRFAFCRFSASVVLPQTLTTICDSAFYCCLSKQLTIPESVTTIGQGAFEYTRMQSIDIPHGIKTIPAKAFKGSGLESIHIPGNIIAIEDEAFRNCSTLEEIIISKETTSIGDCAFSECI